MGPILGRNVEPLAIMQCRPIFVLALKHAVVWINSQSPRVVFNSSRDDSSPEDKYAMASKQRQASPFAF